MSRISSTTLFNFTESLDFLVSNLRDGIYCSRNYEKLPLARNGYIAPMCCFCDIPLSLISEHFEWYGRYGLGIRRTYARRLGVKPVWYVTSENNYVKSIIKDKRLSDYQRKYLIPYLKQFLGYQRDQAGKNRKKKFYDEREWRYISDNDSIDMLFGVNIDVKRQLPIKAEQRMEIELSAIEYIIVDNEDEIERMISELKDIAKGKIKYEVLISKLITAKQIERDF